MKTITQHLKENEAYPVKLMEEYDLIKGILHRSKGEPIGTYSISVLEKGFNLITNTENSLP